MDRDRAIVDQRARYAVGIALLLIVVLLWTGSNFVTQDIFDEGFDKPFLVTYLNTASFAVYLIPFGWQYLRRSAGNAPAAGYDVVSTEPDDDESLDGVSAPALSESALGLPPLTHRETFDLARTFVVIWFLANWTVSASLRYTSVASTTILASTSGFFTLIVGRMFRVETFSLTRVCAVFGSFLGVVLVSQGDYVSDPTSPSPLQASGIRLFQQHDPLLGDILALLSAFFYGLYVTLLKVRVRSESRMDMRLFFGFVGAISICSTWIIGLFLHLTGIEPFGVPNTGRQWGGVILNMLITLSSDYIYVIAMLKTTPLIVTVGLSLTIPCALVGDAFLGTRASFQVMCGALLVVFAFVAVGIEDTWPTTGWAKRLRWSENTDTEHSRDTERLVRSRSVSATR